MERAFGDGASRVRALQGDLYQLFLKVFTLLQSTELPRDSAVMMPLIASGIYGGNIPQSDYMRAFASTFRSAACVLNASHVSPALGVREIRICCYGRDTQLALAEEMNEQVRTDAGSAIPLKESLSWSCTMSHGFVETRKQ